MLMYIGEEQNLCWFCSQTHSPKTMKSRYVIVDIFLTLPIPLLTTLSTDYYLNENIYNVGLRRLFYSKQYYKNDYCSSA